MCIYIYIYVCIYIYVYINMYIYNCMQHPLLNLFSMACMQCMYVTHIHTFLKRVCISIHVAQYCTPHKTLQNSRWVPWLSHTATHCNTLQHTATDCNTLQHTATDCNILHTLQHTTTHCNILRHTATHCNTLQHIATHMISW